MEERSYQRVRACVVRAGPYTSHVTISAFADGQITIPVATWTLMDATGLTRRQLVGAELAVTANVIARADTAVDPHGWQLLAPADRLPAARRSSLYALAPGSVAGLPPQDDQGHGAAA